MKRVVASAMGLAAFGALAACNPFFPGYVGDPHITRDPDSGRFLVYGTTDGYGRGDDLAGGPFCVRESDNLLDWTTYTFSQEDGTFVKPTHNLWAPAAVKGGDGRWYLYYIAHGVNCFVASSATPHGPWRDELDGKPLAPKMFDTDAVRLKGRVFVITMNGSRENRDWGVWIGELNDDMVTWKRPLSLAYTGPDLFEGPGLFERNGKWYLTYSNGSLAGSYHVNYAIADNPFGPYKADKPNNPIMSPDYGTGIICTGHNNVIQIGEEYYICYHRKSSPGSVRLAALQKLAFREDGTIVPMKPSAEWEYPAALPSPPARANLARGKWAWASSEAAGSKCDVTAACKAAKATDGSYGTIWKAASRGEEWLAVDLGTVCEVEETRIHFEFDGVAYRYLLEGSLDGKSWQTFADRTADNSKVNPRTDRGTMKARYLRWRFREGVDVRYPESVGVFEVWAFGRPGPDLALSSISVNGVVPATFGPERVSQVVWVPDADRAKVAASARDPRAKVRVAYDGKLPGKAEITVSSGGLSNVYDISLKKLGRSVSGKPFGAEAESAANAASSAFDGNAATWYEAFSVDDAYVGLDLGAGKAAKLCAIRFCPRKGNARLMVGGVFEGSNDAAEWTELARVRKEPEQGENILEVTEQGAFRLLRYRGPKGSSSCVAEVSFFGETVSVARPQALKGQLAAPARRTGDAVRAVPGTFLNDGSYEGGGKGWHSPWPVKPEKANASDGTWAVNPNSSGRLSQTLEGLEDGVYEFTLDVQGDGKSAEDTLDLFAVGADGEMRTPVTVSGWRKWKTFAVKGIRVNGGRLTVGFAMKRTGRSGMWAWVDNAKLVKVK